MADTVYKEFVLSSPGVWQAVLAFVKRNAAACVERGQPIRLIFTSEERLRNSAQNRRYWGYTLKTITEQAWVNGRQFPAEVWHEYLADRFAAKLELIMPDGEIKVRRKSTTDMTVAEFNEYMTQCEVYAAGELGVEWTS